MNRSQALQLEAERVHIAAGHASPHLNGRTSPVAARSLGARPHNGNGAGPRPTAPERPRKEESPLRNGRLADILSTCSLLFGIEYQDLEAIAAVCTTASFQSQEQIFAEGEPCRGLWVLAEGRVRLFHADAEGRQHVVSFRGPTAALDLAPALDSRPHSASAVALEPCNLVFVPRATLVALGRQYPITIRNVVDQLCIELRQRDIATAVASLRDARGRICCTLVQLARQYGMRTSEGLRIDYRLTRQDVADRAGVTLETAIRVLSDLQRKSVIRTQAQVIDIIDMLGLQHSSDCEDCEMDCTVFSKPHPRAASQA